MTVGQLINHLLDEIEKAKETTWVRKPFSYAMYETWKWCDKMEKERTIQK